MRSTWDAIVIGAGPAGSIAARGLARRGMSVLLVDKAAFPRGKVCGSCLNRSALRTLGRIGLGHVPESLGATPLERITLISRRGRRATLPLAGGCAVSRERLDGALIREACRAGVEFRSQVAATVGEVEAEFRLVLVGGITARARSVIVADGLAGTSLAKLPEFSPRIVARSRIGIGAIIEQPPADFDRGAITMVCGRHGYVGAAWVEGNRLDIAAAVNPRWLREIGGPGEAIASILGEAGAGTSMRGSGGQRGPDPLIAWRGTPALTRRRRVEAERLLVIGDAAGYVEPFTGEGLAWAMAGAEAVAQVVTSGESWTRRHAALVAQAQLQCRVIARLLRHPTAASLAIALLAQVPALASPLIRRLHHSEAPA